MTNVEDWDLVDLKIPAAPGSLMRAVQLWHTGYFRLARRDAELYSVQITCSGAWAHFKLFNGRGRVLFNMPSAFTGSFWLGAGAEDGLIAHLYSASQAPTLTVNFRERDLQLV